MRVNKEKLYLVQQTNVIEPDREAYLAYFGCNPNEYSLWEYIRGPFCEVIEAELGTRVWDIHPHNTIKILVVCEECKYRLHSLLDGNCDKLTKERIHGD